VRRSGNWFQNDKCGQSLARQAPRRASEVTDNSEIRFRYRICLESCHGGLHQVTQGEGRGRLHSPRFHVHFTPKGASWINQVERFFAELTNRQLRRGVRIAVRLNWSAPSATTSTSRTATPNPSSGPRPLTRSSRRSSIFVSESLGQDTRALRNLPAHGSPLPTECRSRGSGVGSGYLGWAGIAAATLNSRTGDQVNSGAPSDERRRVALNEE
jgi:hypothetical protein